MHRLVRLLLATVLLPMLLITSMAPVSLLRQTPAARAQNQVLACGGTFLAVADAAVAAPIAGVPEQPLGEEGFLRVAQGQAGAWRSLIAFNIAQALPPEATIHSAVLELPVEQGSPPFTLDVRGLRDQWDERTVTWSTQPAAGASFGSVTVAPHDGVLSVDVTTLVTLWATGAFPQTSLALLPAAAELDLLLASRETQNGPRLVIRCAAAQTAPPANQSAGDQRQMTGLTRLSNASQQPVELQLHPRGAVRFASFRLAVPATVAGNNLARALWFLNDYRDLLRLAEPARDLQLDRRSDDGQHLFFRQRHQGIPVYGAEVGLHLDRSQVVGLAGNYVPGITLDPHPRLDAGQAEALARAIAGAAPVGETQLRYVNPSLLGEQDQRTHLAWQVNVPHEQLFIDADSGALVLRVSLVLDHFNLRIETGNNSGPYGNTTLCWYDTSDDDLWMTEDGEEDDAVDAETRAAYNHIVATDGFWRHLLGRNSYDNDGERIDMYVHVGKSWRNAHYAQYCDIFEFGDGMPTRDIIAHEFTHGVIRHSAKLIYLNQSGALNESFADLFAFFVDNDDWTMGEGSTTGIIRDLSNPPTYRQPDRMSNYNPTTEDKGGVHTNSGIHNKAGYLIINGGSFNGRTIKGIGGIKGRALFYDMLTARLWSSAQLLDARNAAVAEALSEVGGLHKFTAADVCDVRNAYAAVELGPGDLDCDGTEDNVDDDLDGDKWPNSSDNCPEVPNTSQSDIDGDTLGDACDSDRDGDARANGMDNCPDAHNPTQADVDGDRRGDACDDSDTDGVVDASDNCRTVYNDDQKDNDGDGQGDVCDLDDDNDGKQDPFDNCQFKFNPGQQDGDGDFHGDACDLCPGVADPDNRDLDKDGKANPCDDDDDGDGLLDGADNCPEVANPGQKDLNKNGIGWDCDEDERMEHISKAASKTPVSMRLRFPGGLPGDTPIPIGGPGPIGPDGPDYLPAGYKVTVNINMPVGFQARIVDSTGITVAKGDGAGTLQTLSFKPVPFAGAALPAAGQSAARPASASQGLLAAAPDAAAYRLVIMPAEGVDPNQEFDLLLTVDQGQPTVYVPLLAR